MCMAAHSHEGTFACWDIRMAADPCAACQHVLHMEGFIDSLHLLCLHIDSCTAPSKQAYLYRRWLLGILPAIIVQKLYLIQCL